jgi:16S rRNA (uracil1498-N3)-methyltransferase
MALHRFFAPALDPGDEEVVLPRDEAEHLTRVLRLAAGDTVSIFDGRGHEFLARIAEADRRAVRVRLVSRIEPTREPAVSLTLVQAVLKADKMDEIVRDAAMLGVAAVQPIVARRTEASVAMLLRAGKLDRWRRIALASVKQARRATLTEIRTPLPFDSYVDEPPPALRIIFVEPGLGPPSDPVATLQHEPVPADAALLIGPEGGWTEAECALARERGIRAVTLGQRTLRADAMPVAAISVLQFLWGDL